MKNNNTLRQLYDKANQLNMEKGDMNNKTLAQHLNTDIKTAKLLNKTLDAVSNNMVSGNKLDMYIDECMAGK